MSSDSALPPVAHVLVDVPPGSRRPQSLANPEPVHHTSLSRSSGTLIAS